jgi:hypothetical protein
MQATYHRKGTYALLVLGQRKDHNERREQDILLGVELVIDPHFKSKDIDIYPKC